jgi:hypothetical protein
VFGQHFDFNGQRRNGGEASCWERNPFEPPREVARKLGKTRRYRQSRNDRKKVAETPYSGDDPAFAAQFHGHAFGHSRY